MKMVKYINLLGKLSSIEGQREAVVGQLYLKTKLYKRGEVTEEDFVQSYERYETDIKSLNHKKWCALKNYAVAA